MGKRCKWNRALQFLIMKVSQTTFDASNKFLHMYIEWYCLWKTVKK